MTQVQPIENTTQSGKWKTYPAYKDSGVEWLGEIPEHWEVKRLKETVIACQNGIWGDEPNNDANDVVCIRVADFDRTRNRVNDTNLTFRSVLPSQQRSRILKRGDLLLEKSGGGELQPVGVVVLYDLDILAVCSNFIAKMFVADHYDSAFLCHLHSFLYSIRLNTCSIKQNTGIQNLDSYAYLCEKVSIPSLPEQRAIAAFLDRETARINNLIAKKERMIELLREKRTALISHAVTKGLDLTVKMKDSGVEWIGEIPEHWEVKKIKRFCQVKRGASPRPIDNPDYFDDEGEYSWVRISDVTASHKFLLTTEQRLSPLGQSKSICLEPGELFLSIAGSVGKPIITNIKCCIHDGFVYFVNLVQNREYLFYVFSGDELYAGLGKMGTQLNLNTDTIGDMRIPLPPLPEQQAFVAYLDQETAKIDALITRIGEGIEKLKEYSTALISAAVTGKIDVRGEIDNLKD